MKKRKLGKSGIEIAPIAFGGNVFGWTVGEKVSFQLLDATGFLRLTFHVSPYSIPGI